MLVMVLVYVESEEWMFVVLFVLGMGDDVEWVWVGGGVVFVWEVEV